MIKAGLIEDCACWNGPGFAEFIISELLYYGIRR